MDDVILVTTPTGGIGSQVLADLLECGGGEQLRVIVRDPSRLPAQARERVDVVVGSHGDAEVVERALEDVDAVLWVVPLDGAATSLHVTYSGFTEPAAEAFTAHGVSHVVGVSALGRGTRPAADAGLVTASLAMDDLIAGSGVAYRALVNPSFFENLLGDADTISEDGVFTDLVAADRRAPLVATRDIAATAAALLTDRSWTGTGEVPVLGPEDVSPNDLARVMTEVLDRPVRYERQAPEDFAAALAGFGVGPALVQGLVAMKRAKDEGLDAGVRRTPETASPTTFRQWCVEVLEPAVRQ